MTVNGFKNKVNHKNFNISSENYLKMNRNKINNMI